MGGWISKPPTPDYTAAAREQGAANVEATRTANLLNNPNTVGPTGNVTYTIGPDGRPTQTTSLSEQEQRLYELTGRAQTGGLEALLEHGMPAVNRALATNYQQPGQASGDLDQRFMTPYGIQQETGFRSAPGLQTGLDFSGAPAMPQDSMALRQQVADSIYGQGSKTLDKHFTRRRGDEEARLSNQGIFRGSEADARVRSDLSAEEESAYGDLRSRSIQEGGNAAQQIHGMQLGARQQGVNEITGQGQFANQARGDYLNQYLASMGAHNAANQQGFNQAQAATGLANAGRAQNMQEQTQATLLPINVMNALLSQGQVTMPQAQQYQGQAIAPAPVFQATQSTYQANQNAASQQNALTGQLLSTAGTVASAFV
jgi:hypothetical protein